MSNIAATGSRPRRASTATRTIRKASPEARHPGGSSDGGSARRSVVPGDPVLDDRSDPLAPFAAVEDSVMADALGEMILLQVPRQLRRDVERRLGLADSRNVVALPLDEIGRAHV